MELDLSLAPALLDRDLVPEFPDQLIARGVELWNMYGPTETTVWSTCARIAPSNGNRLPAISIGQPQPFGPKPISSK